MQSFPVCTDSHRRGPHGGRSSDQWSDRIVAGGCWEIKSLGTAHSDSALPLAGHQWIIMSQQGYTAAQAAAYYAQNPGAYQYYQVRPLVDRLIGWMYGSAEPSCFLCR